MGFAAVFNFCEAILWFCLAAVFLFYGFFKKVFIRKRSLLFFLSAFLIVFGISDLIEMKTGAWWRPPSLFLLKAVCVTGIVVCFVLIYRNVRLKKSVHKARGINEEKTKEYY